MSRGRQECGPKTPKAGQSVLECVADGHAIAVLTRGGCLPERSYPRHYDDGDDLRRNRFFSDAHLESLFKSFGAAMQINSGLRPILSLPGVYRFFAHILGYRSKQAVVYR